MSRMRASDRHSGMPSLAPIRSSFIDEAMPPDAAADSGRNDIFSLAINDRNALYASYMPFLKGGGLFVPSQKPHKLGDHVFLLLVFPDTAKKVPIAGQVVWVTPQDAIGGRTPGIGVQFSAKDAGMACAKIEAYLGDQLSSDRPTHTM